MIKLAEDESKGERVPEKEEKTKMKIEKHQTFVEESIGKERGILAVAIKQRIL